MGGTRWWIGVSAGVALGLGVVAAVEVSTAPASAASGVATVTQLQQVRRVAVTALKRDNINRKKLTSVSSRLPMHAVSTGEAGSDLVPGRGFGAVSSQRLTDGNYRLRFYRDISTCTWSATLAATSGTIPAATSIRLALDTTEPTHTQLVVRTSDGAGNPVNSPFMVQVFC